MKALLINPPFFTTWPLSLGFGEPLGLAYIAASLEQSGRHSAEILDCVGSAPQIQEPREGELSWIGLGYPEVLARMAKHQFDVVGISMLRTSDVDPGTTALLAMIKAEYPEVPIIIGGPEATHSWEDYVHCAAVSYIVLGEGEKTIVDLLDAMEGRGSVGAVKGIVFLDAEGAAQKTAAQDIADIHAIPWPARNLLPMRTYIENRPTTERRAAAILTSRACPYHCAFCSTIHVWGNKWRGRTAQDVVDEIKYLVNEYQVDEIIIQDDNFCVNRDRVHAICDLLINDGVNVVLHIAPGVMSSLANADLLKNLNAAGMKSINMQLESGHEKTQSYISKKIDLNHMQSMVDCAHSLGMAVNTNIIIGFPFETKEEMEKSVNVAISIGFDNIDFIYVIPKDNTRVHQDFIKCGIVVDGEEIVLPVRTMHCSSDEVRSVRDWAVKAFENSKLASRQGRCVWLDPAAIRHDDGYCYFAPILDAQRIADEGGFLMRSPAKLYEDERLLGAAHASHHNIRVFGEGRYSHWMQRVYFSASDNSDPRSNGRIYRLEY